MAHLPVLYIVQASDGSSFSPMSKAFISSNLSGSEAKLSMRAFRGGGLDFPLRKLSFNHAIVCGSVVFIRGLSFSFFGGMASVMATSGLVFSGLTAAMGE